MNQRTRTMRAGLLLVAQVTFGTTALILLAFAIATAGENTADATRLAVYAAASLAATGAAHAANSRKPADRAVKSTSSQATSDVIAWAKTNRPELLTGPYTAAMRSTDLNTVARVFRRGAYAVPALVSTAVAVAGVIIAAVVTAAGGNVPAAFILTGVACGYIAVAIVLGRGIRRGFRRLRSAQVRLQVHLADQYDQVIREHVRSLTR